VRDDDVRASCFAALDVLQAQHGPELPWFALEPGFAFRGRRVPFLNRAYGIYRAAEVQRGPAALSINSAFAQKRYQDEGTADGVLYRYQDGRSKTTSIRGYARRTSSECRSSTSSARGRTGIDPSIRRLLRTTSPTKDLYSSRSGECAVPWTSASQSTSTTRSSGGTSCVRSSSASTRRNFAARCYLRTATAAQSAL
jgi:hypothetical protein